MRSATIVGLQWGDEGKGKILDALAPRFGQMRLYVLYKDGRLSGFLDYVRSRLRLARSTVLNILMVGIFGGLALRDSQTWLPIFILATVAALAAAVYAWARIKSVYQDRLEYAYWMIRREEGKAE